MPNEIEKIIIFIEIDVARRKDRYRTHICTVTLQDQFLRVHDK